MLRKAGILIAVVMLMAFTAGVSLAGDFLTYRDAGANYFPTAAIVTSSATNPFPGTGNNLVDGMVTGMVNGAPTDQFVNPQGLGDALIYGYYNVRDGGVNIFTLTNTAPYSVRARIRFLNAKDSCEILDFDICLSDHDVWTGYIVNDSGVGRLFSIDVDTPVDYGQHRGLKPGQNADHHSFGLALPDGVAFRQPAGATCAVTLTDDDTLEGYFVVIAENRLIAETDFWRVGDAVSEAGTCGKKESGTGHLAGQWLNDDVTAAGRTGTTTLTGDIAVGGVGNVLYGTDFQVTSAGTTYAYNATAVGDFSNTIYIVAPTASNPNLADASPNPYIALGNVAIDEINFILTKNMIMQQWYDFSGLAQTEWIVNFPTKKISDDEGLTLFDDPKVLVTAYDDKENSKVTVCEFSPCPGTSDVVLPYEVNVLSINGAAIFDSVVVVDLKIDDYDFGYMTVDLVNSATEAPVSPAHATTLIGGAGAGVNVTSLGLPTIGYMVTDFGSGINYMLPLIYTNLITIP